MSCDGKEWAVSAVNFEKEMQTIASSGEFLTPIWSKNEQIACGIVHFFVVLWQTLSGRVANANK